MAAEKRTAQARRAMGIEEGKPLPAVEDLTPEQLRALVDFLDEEGQRSVYAADRTGLEEAEERFRLQLRVKPTTQPLPEAGPIPQPAQREPAQPAGATTQPSGPVTYNTYHSHGDNFYLGDRGDLTEPGFGAPDVGFYG